MGDGRNSVDGREVPDTEEVDMNFYGEGISESVALFPPFFVTACIHLICKRNLLLIVRRKEPNLTVGRRLVKGCGAIQVMQYLGKHPSENTGGICAS